MDIFPRTFVFGNVLSNWRKSGKGIRGEIAECNCATDPWRDKWRIASGEYRSPFCLISENLAGKFKKIPFPERGGGTILSYE